MKLISLGGIGGCDLAESLRSLHQEAYPYDWLITTQTFIINSFNDFNKFFVFDTSYIYNETNLLTVDKKAIMLHDFKNFTIERNDVVEKYRRRFERLKTALYSNDTILFVRIYDNLEESLAPANYYDTILVRDIEDIQRWEEFIVHIQTTFMNTNIKLLLITSNKDICSVLYPNIIIYFTKDHKSSKAITTIIQDTIQHLTTTA